MELNFPKYEFKLQKRDNGIYIFDEFRKKHIKLTPEEWVRQHSLKFLVEEKQIPKSLIAVEKQIEINNQIFRFDGLVYDKQGNPLILIECKAPQIPINQNVADQIFTYNYQIQAPYIFLTNGIKHLFYRYSKTKKNIKSLNELPIFNNLF